MAFRNQLQQWFSTPTPAPVTARRAPVTLGLDVLEDRLALAVYAVTTTADVVNPMDGVLSLREAVLAANASADNDEIVLQSGANYLLNFGQGDDNAHEGDLDILNNGSLTFTGNGATIDGNQLDRVFDVQGATVVFSNLTITGGRATDGGSAGGLHAIGGGILNNGGNLTLNGVTIRDNVAQGPFVHNAYGGGLASLNGILALTDVSFEENEALGGEASGEFAGSAYGGGMYATGTSVTIVGISNWISNAAIGGGGYVEEAGNASGGAIFASNGTNLDLPGTFYAYRNVADGGDVLFPDSSAGYADGGAITVEDGSLTMRSGAQLVENKALGGNGGASYGDARGGGLSVFDGDVVLESNVLISGNLALGGTGSDGFDSDQYSLTLGGHGGSAYGGGAYLDSYSFHSATLNAIFSGNVAQGGDGGLGGDNTNANTFGYGNAYLGGAGGSGGYAAGGGVYSIGLNVTVLQASFLNNTAQGGNGKAGGAGHEAGPMASSNAYGDGGWGGFGGGAEGGGLFVDYGTISISQSTFSGNSALGGEGGAGGNAAASNSAFGGDAGGGGSARGGGLYLNSDSIVIGETTIASNVARGGNGQQGGNSPLGAAGRGSYGGDGQGGGAFAAYSSEGYGGGTLEVYRSTFAYNQAIGGHGGDGGSGAYSCGCSNFGYGNSGGRAQGGGLYAHLDTIFLSNSTFSDNSVTGGDGGDGPDIPFDPQFPSIGGHGGDAEGGGIYIFGLIPARYPNPQFGPFASLIEEQNVVPGQVVFEHLTVAFNSATAGAAGAGAINGNAGVVAGGGVFVGSGITSTVSFSIFSNNSAAFAPDFSGDITSTQNLFLSVEGLSGYTANDYVGIDPLLGALQNNGGFTATRALGTGSVAIDTATLSGYVNDQRNFLRPQDGNGDGTFFNDIGAYEAPPPDVPDLDIPDDNPYDNPGDLTSNPNGPAQVPVVEYPPQIPLPVTVTPAAPRLEAKLGSQTPDNPVKVSVIRVFRIVKIDGKPIRELVTTILAKDMDAASVRAILINKQPGVYQITMSLDLAEFLVWEGEIPLQTVSSLDAALDKVYNALQDRTDPLKHLRDVLEGTQQVNPVPAAPPAQSQTPAVTDPTSAAPLLDPDWASQADRFWQNLPLQAWEDLNTPLPLNRWHDLADLPVSVANVETPTPN